MTGRHPRERSVTGAVVDTLRSRATRLLSAAREGWGDESSWRCAFCGAETAEEQFWCRGCSRCRYDGEALSPADIDRHWETHLGSWAPRRRPGPPDGRR